MGSCTDSTFANPVAQSATAPNTPGRRDNAGRELRSGGHPPAHTSVAPIDPEIPEFDGATSVFPASALSTPLVGGGDRPPTRRPPGGWTPEEFATRFPALAGKPDLDNHAQVVEAIGYKARSLMLARRKRWTRVQRREIENRVYLLKADAGVSLGAARTIWAELLAGRVPEGAVA